MNKKRLIVLLLSLSMIMSQMSVFSFADDEAAPAQEQPAVEQTVQEEAPAVAEEPSKVEAEPAKVEETAPAEETAAPAPAQTEEAKAVANEPAKEEPAEEAFSASKTVDGVVVSVKAAKGVFPAGSTLSVKKVAKPASVDTADAAKAYAFDITIKDAEGNEIQPDGKAEVSFRTAEVAKYDTEVYHISDSGKVDELGVSESGKTATVETKGFSVFVVTFKYGTGETAKEYTLKAGEYILATTLLEKMGISYTSVISAKSSKAEVVSVSEDGTDFKLTVVNGTGLNNDKTATVTINYRYTSAGATHDDGVATINLTVLDIENTANVTEPTAKTGLVAGNTKPLINAGTTNVGQWEYKLGDKGNWTTVVSAITASAVGTYTVYYKLVGKNGETEGDFITPKSLTVEITENLGTMTVTAKDIEATYDGTLYGTAADAMTVSVTPTAATPTIYYSLDKELTDQNYTTEGKTSERDVAPRDAGHYTMYLYATCEGYADASTSVSVDISKAWVRITVADKEVQYGTYIDYKNMGWNTALDSGYINVKAYSEEAEGAASEITTFDPSVLDGTNFKFDYGDYKSPTSEVSEGYPIGIATLPPETNNYKVRASAGKLKVIPKPVTFTWSTPQEWTYDGQEHSVFAKVNQDDLVGSDKQSGQVTINYVDDQVAYTNKATEVLRDAEWNVDKYVAKILSLDGPRGHNYTFTKTPVNKEKTTEAGSDVCAFKINPAALTLTPVGFTIEYGDDPQDTIGANWKDYFTASELVGDEKILEVLEGTPVTYAFGEYEVGSNAGSYNMTISNTLNTANGLRANNYQLTAVTNVNGLKVDPRKVTFHWDTTKDLEYNGDYKYAWVDSVDNDATKTGATSALSDLRNQGEAAYENAKKIDANTYIAKAKLSSGVAGNYDIQDESDKFTWTITKRPATIYANNKTITYGQDPDNSGYYVDNKTLVTRVDATEPDSIGDVSFTYNYVKNGKPGYYSITPVVDNLNENYYIANTVAGTLTVNDVPGVLVAQGTKSGSRGIRVSWNSVTGAASYDVYMSLCNTKKKVYTPAYVGTTSGNSLRVTKLGKKKLKKRTCYKYYVVAKDASGKVIATSAMGHFITGNVKGKTVNAKSMSVNTSAITLTRGGTAKINASYTKAKKGKKYKLLNSSHEALTRYISTNTAVATVDANGYVYAAGRGYCKVYVLGVSGMWRIVEVYVN